MITQLQNSKLLKGFVLTMVLAFFNLSLYATPFRNEIIPQNKLPYELESLLSFDVEVDNKVLLRAGTPIIVETTNRLNSKNLNVGQSVDLRVKYDIMVGNKMAIPAGSIALGKISRIEKAKGFGKAGMMEIQIENVMAVDGQVIPISGIPRSVEGESKKGLAITVAVVGGLFYILPGFLSLLIKGKNAELASGTTINGNIAANREVEVEVYP